MSNVTYKPASEGASIIPVNTTIETQTQTDGSQRQVIALGGADGGQVVTVSDRVQTPTGYVMQVQAGVNDVIYGLPVYLPYDQHQIHEGETWKWSLYIASLASGVSRDIVFTVPVIAPPANGKIAARCPHFRYEANTNDLCNFFLYEAPTVTAATGTPQSPINLERNGTYIVQMTILDAPTVTGVGTLIDDEYMLAASTNQNSADNMGSSIDEYIFKSNTKYLFRITSGAAGCKIHVKFKWYEDLGV